MHQIEKSVSGFDHFVPINLFFLNGHKQAPTHCRKLPHFGSREFNGGSHFSSSLEGIWTW
jgi:hypothetical protein